eukprot:766507-Hanusia_phi.AAC.1
MSVVHKFNQHKFKQLKQLYSDVNIKLGTLHGDRFACAEIIVFPGVAHQPLEKYQPRKQAQALSSRWKQAVEIKYDLSLNLFFTSSSDGEPGKRMEAKQ